MEAKRWPGKYYGQGPDKYGDVCVTSDLGGFGMRLVIASMRIPHPEDILDDDGNDVPVERSREMARGTADLFAAAPDLYEALCDMVSDHACLSEATLQFARAAIAKAEGK